MSTVEGHHSKSRRIASNTIALFLRMLVVTIINLYAVRLVLRGLGYMDYGIFKTIASVIAISTCISTTLSVAIQRFYSMALGHQDPTEFNKIFSASINVVMGLSVVVVIIFETIGLWFVNTHLVIPDDRMMAANWIYQLALGVLLLSILQIPFMAAIFAYESMGSYALISMLECLLKLGVAYLIAMATTDSLVFYSSGLLVVAVIIFLLYFLTARNKYKSCRYRKMNDRDMYRQLLSFSGWTLFGAIANVGLIQGSSILLDIFWGPLIVTSFGISLEINTAFSALSSSMVLSFRPAMIKAYAEKDTGYLDQLFVACNKFIIYVLAAAALPIIFEMDTILHLWLGKVSATTVLFARLIIFYIVIAALHNPITIIMQASGHIKEYHLPVESVCLLSVPLTWLLFRLGCPTYSVFVSMILLCLLAHIVRVVCLSHYHATFSLSQYLLHTICPSMLIILIGAMLTACLHHVVDASLPRLFIVGILSPLSFLGIVFFIGLSRQERALIRQFAVRKKGGGR